MPTKFLASGRFSRPSKEEGSGSGSVFAFLIFLTISSLESVKFIRVASDVSDLLIFELPSRSDITRAAVFWIKGSGAGNISVSNIELNARAISRVSSRCCF